MVVVALLVPSDGSASSAGVAELCRRFLRLLAPARTPALAIARQQQQQQQLQQPQQQPHCSGTLRAEFIYNLPVSIQPDVDVRRLWGTGGRLGESETAKRSEREEGQLCCDRGSAIGIVGNQLQRGFTMAIAVAIPFALTIPPARPQ